MNEMWTEDIRHNIIVHLIKYKMEHVEILFKLKFI